MLGRTRAGLGVLDETAHAALGALLADGRAPVEARAMVAASLLIDLDHAPSELGREWLRPPELGRPYPHALITVALVAAAIRDPAARRGAVLGLLAHLARDMTDTDSGVRLLWPLTRREFFLPPALYPVLVGALCVR